MKMRMKMKMKMKKKTEMRADREALGFRGAGVLTCPNCRAGEGL
jgi:hypothetical protein